MIFKHTTALFTSIAALVAISRANPIAFDGSLGTAGAIQPNKGTFQIAPQEHSIRGSNLLHSFSDFSIPPNMTADFTGPGEIRSIIAKVTGGGISHIEGTLKSSIPNADFFLINPSGIIFSKSAKLDVTGSFTATTADQFIDEDKQVFSVINTSDSFLRVAPLTDFGFTKNSASASAGHGTISSAAKIELPRGSLRLVGRQVMIDSGSISVRKDLQITAVGSGATTVSAATSIPASISENAAVHITKSALVPGGFGRSLEIHGGEIQVSESSLNFLNFQTATPASVRMVSSNDMILDRGTIVASVTSTGVGDNTIRLNAGGKIGLDRSLVTTFTRGTATAGSISVAASSLDIKGNADGVEWGIVSASGASGAGGDLTLQVVNQTNISNGGLIASIAFAQGDAGKLSINTDSLQITGLIGLVEPDAFLTGVVGISQGTGKGGDITVQSRDIHLIRGGLIDSSAFVSGRGGDIFVNSLNLTIDRMGSRFFTGIGSDAEGAASAGRVEVNSSNIFLNNGGLISSSSSGMGGAGDVLVKAKQIVITGGGLDSPFVVTESSGIVASTANGSSGKGGRIEVGADHVLRIENGGVIGAESLGSGVGGQVTVVATDTRIIGGGRISSNAGGTGTAGNVLLETGSLYLEGSEIGVRALAAKAGNLAVTATGNIHMSGGLITATADGAGDGGNVMVTSLGATLLYQGSRIEAATTGSGAAGLVEIGAASTTLSGGSGLFSDARGTGKAGGIIVSSGDLFLGHSTMAVSALVADAGNLEVTVSGDIRMTGGLVTASAGQDGGDIVIRANGIIYLAQSVVTADAQGNGGNITFEGARHLVLNGTTLSASAVDENGGNIFISTGTFFANESILSVTSARGAPGTVTIETIDSLSGGEETREVELLNPDDVLQPDCTKRAASTASSFTQAGRGGTSRLPGGYLPSFRIFE